MPANLDPVYGKTPGFQGTVMASISAANICSTVPAGHVGYIITAINVISTVSATLALTLNIVSATGTVQLAKRDITGNAGNVEATAGFNLLDGTKFPGLSLDNAGNKLLFLPEGCVLQCFAAGVGPQVACFWQDMWDGV